MGVTQLLRQRQIRGKFLRSLRGDLLVLDEIGVQWRRKNEQVLHMVIAGQHHCAVSGY